ncbi:copper transport protein CTR2 [Ceratobasidium sp. AG-Ba]|nr:copper transport protein CTR2 [Ceratobasidium sp. AG-Ba]QRW09266.1 copper transport protein CTR2 [Ceratobasidium sp. AG-Ba]
MAAHTNGRDAMPILDDDVVSGIVFRLGFDGSSFIFPSLRIKSWPTFLAACLITAAICLSERYLTYLISLKWTPLKKKTPLTVSFWRTAMYWVVTLERLIYMLIAMSFHVGLILAIVTSLAIGQFFIEFQEAKGSVGPRHVFQALESYYPLRSSSEMENEPYTDPPSSLFPFTPANRSSQADNSHFHIPLPSRSSSPPDSELLSPTYRASPRRVVFQVPENTDVGSGSGRDRAREIMGGGR